MKAAVFAFAGAICWLDPADIAGLLFHSKPLNAHVGVLIGAVLFIGAAILAFVQPELKRLNLHSGCARVL